MSLSSSELERYSRQLLLDGWSGEVQERLRDSRALVVGVGALGSPVAQYLAAAGVGSIGLVDGDEVELSNLQRQPIHLTPDIGRPKAEVAAAKLGLLNPDVLVEPYPVRVEETNAEAILAGADVVVDCSDSFETRYRVNDGCCAQAIPLVEAGVAGFDGLVLSIRPGASACYRCAFEQPPADERPCHEVGVLGALAGVIGSIQALEALKLLTGVGEPLTDTILQLDGATMAQTLVAVGRRAGCVACGESAGAALGS